jgi:hypothetical protein
LAPFWRSRAKNRAFRFNLFAAGRQKGFPLQSLDAWASSNFALQNCDQPLAPQGLTYALTPNSAYFRALSLLTLYGV